MEEQPQVFVYQNGVRLGIWMDDWGYPPWFGKPSNLGWTWFKHPTSWGGGGAPSCRQHSGLLTQGRHDWADRDLAIKHWTRTIKHIVSSSNICLWRINQQRCWYIWVINDNYTLDLYGHGVFCTLANTGLLLSLSSTCMFVHHQNMFS